MDLINQQLDNTLLSSEEKQRKHTACLLCNSQNILPLEHYYDSKGLVKCSNCNFVFMEAIPTDMELFEYYKGYAYTEDEVLSLHTIKSYNNLLNEFEKYRETNRILDVGAGRGFFLDQAKKRGWQVYGTEFSQKAIELCESKGHQMQSGVLNSEVFGDKKFDVITSFEVLEHINTPNEELNQISSLLRVGGLFYCTTPNFNSLMRYYLKDNYNVIVYPEHLSYYTKKTLNSLMQKHRFTKVKFESTGISLERIKQSKASSNTNGDNLDEKLRDNISKKWYLALVKKIANILLSLSSTGLTLKGYFVKEK